MTDRNKLSLVGVLGLCLLYASAYFLPLVSPSGFYLLPSHSIVRLIVFPTFVAVLGGAVAGYASSKMAKKWLSPQAALCAEVLVLSLLALIALKGMLTSVGYGLEVLVPRGNTLLASEEIVKACALIVMILTLWIVRRRLANVTRVLSSVGFAFAVMAVARTLMIMSGQHVASGISASTVGGELRVMRAIPASARPRRVVWVIFDESDLGRMDAANQTTEFQLENFKRLTKAAVVATDANTPASATFYSVPALLSDKPIGGVGAQISNAGVLSLEGQDHKFFPFNESSTVFGAVNAMGGTASALGFYHPYCKLFKLSRCDSFPWPGIGSVYSVLRANIPDSIFAKLGFPDDWQSITTSLIALLPEYVARDDSLTFIHINVPHLPAAYADRVLRLPSKQPPLIEYSHNLKLADQLLGGIVKQLQDQALRHDSLLVISSDHWLRKRWYQADAQEQSKPVPFIVWRVNDTDGLVLPQPLSTVHTAAMILDFLSGEITTEAQIAKWWENRQLYPTFIAPHT